MTKEIKLNESFYEELRERIKPYFENALGHPFDHTERVLNLTLHLAENENVDIDVIKTSALLHDVCRAGEERGKLKCHAEEGAKIARDILESMNFPSEKIALVCNAIESHRKSGGVEPQTEEAKILWDADMLDAYGAIDISRVLLSSFAGKYKKPVYTGNRESADENLSAINFLKYKLAYFKPESFNTKKGKELARKRYDFTKLFVETFINEWEGEL